MSVQHGGESDDLAPVTPIFGRIQESPPAVSPEPAGEAPVDNASTVAARWGSTWADDVADDPDEDEDDDDEDDGYDECAAIEREIAENLLLKKLRSRALSVSEATQVVRARAIDSASIEELIDSFRRRGYLDDQALAEQLVHTGVQRKGQGRQALVRVLAKRGIPRDIASAVISGMPDDDADRALEFARQKARSLDQVDHDAALRRVVGALSRRGYPGSQALAAAREALAERSDDRVKGPSATVRFR